MRIAIDAMGGDYAPQEIVQGAIQAAQVWACDIILVGNEKKISDELKQQGHPAGIAVYHCEEIIGMEEEPATAIRRKKDASIVVATRLVKEETADAVVSAGSTGAQMVSSLFTLGRLPGISRPAIATMFPTVKGSSLILDVGANSTCKPHNLVQFAYMGSIYLETILGISNPRVGLLNIGSEETKGTELIQEAYQVLKTEQLNFVGNIEARSIPYGAADVIVCDGFVGNIVLKFAEGLAGAFFSLIKQEIDKSLARKLGGALVLPALREIKKKLDYAEHGGAPLLGVNGVSIICHGSSKAKAIKNAVGVAQKCVENKFVERLSEAMALQSGKGELDD